VHGQKKEKVRRVLGRGQGEFVKGKISRKETDVGCRHRPGFDSPWKRARTTVKPRGRFLLT